MTDGDDRISYLGYFTARWKALVGVVLAAIVVVAIPAISVTTFSSPDYNVHAVWPERLSANAPAKMAVSLHDYGDDNDLSGTATLYYGWSPDDDQLARAYADDEFAEIASAPIDAHGTAVLDIPAAKPLPARAEDAPPSQPSLILRIEADGHERWYHRTLEQVDAPVLALTLDRPLYQPGQTIMMRALVASAVTGKPLDTTAKFVVRDPKSNLVMDVEVETGANGIAATELGLADRCLQGQYTVEVSSAGQTTTEYVDVRPFRLPRFKVVVTSESAEVQPGDRLNARVVATYTYGEPVVDADVAVVASAGALPLPGTSGKTDTAGAFDVVLDIPRNVAAGAVIQLHATVTSVAGRAEGGRWDYSGGGAQRHGRSAPSRRSLVRLQSGAARVRHRA